MILHWIFHRRILLYAGTEFLHTQINKHFYMMQRNLEPHRHSRMQMKYRTLNAAYYSSSFLHLYVVEMPLSSSWLALEQYDIYLFLFNLFPPVTVSVSFLLVHIYTNRTISTLGIYRCLKIGSHRYNDICHTHMKLIKAHK